jgi:hypothetical protein
MRYADLSPSTQALLVGLLAAALAVILTRVAVLLRRERAGYGRTIPALGAPCSAKLWNIFGLWWDLD